MLQSQYKICKQSLYFDWEQCEEQFFMAFVILVVIFLSCGTVPDVGGEGEADSGADKQRSDS